MTRIMIKKKKNKYKDRYKEKDNSLPPVRTGKKGLFEMNDFDFFYYFLITYP